MTSENQLSLQDYIVILRRRAPYMAAIFVIVLLIAISISVVLPPVYRATGIIMVETQISDNILSTTVRTQLEDQVNNIKQRVMTRENLLQLSNRYDLFRDNSGSINSTDLVERMRKLIVVEMGDPNDNRTNQQGRQAIAFSLSFENRHPDVAFKVTNDLVQLFLDLNVKLRTEDAIETTGFLTQESDKLKVEVDRLEKLISDFKQQNKNALPEQLTLRMTMLSRAENDMREVERDIRSTKEELRTLEVELSASRHGIGDDHSAQTLPALEAELNRLQSIYTDSHPDVVRLKRKIDAMEKAGGQPAGSVNSSNPAIFRIQARMESDKARLISLEQQREMLQRKMADNENAMIRTPRVEQELAILVRDRDSAQRKFEELRNKRMNAKIAETLESESKSGKFTVLEPPLMPERPFKPNRLKIILIGFFLAIAAAGGGIMLLETVDQRIRGSDSLADVLGYRPIAVIPYLHSMDDDLRKHNIKRQVIKYVAIAFAVIFILLVLVNFIYAPIGEIYMKIITRFK